MKDTLVVTATLGDRETLNRTIKSVQKYGGERVFHVIVSPESKCDEIRKRYPFIEVIAEPKSCKGIYGALNYGLNKFVKDYKYLTYINDDDFWLEDYLKLFKEIEVNDNIDVVYGRVNFINDKGEVIGEQTSSSRYKAFKALLSKNIMMFTQQATLIQSKLFIEMGGFSENLKLISDTKFWLDALAKNAKFKYINKICSAYTIQEGQLSSNGNLINEELRSLNLGIIYKNSLIPIFEVFLFRLFNLKIYVKRFIKYRKIVKMWRFFHKE